MQNNADVLYEVPPNQDLIDAITSNSSLKLKRDILTMLVTECKERLRRQNNMKLSRFMCRMRDLLQQTTAQDPDALLKQLDHMARDDFAEEIKKHFRTESTVARETIGKGVKFYITGRIFMGNYL